VGLSGTGDGDYFLRMTCCKDIAARCRYGGVSLREAAKAVVGPGGEMARYVFLYEIHFPHSSSSSSLTNSREKKRKK